MERINLFSFLTLWFSQIFPFESGSDLVLFPQGSFLTHFCILPVFWMSSSTVQMNIDLTDRLIGRWANGSEILSHNHRIIPPMRKRCHVPLWLDSLIVSRLSLRRSSSFLASDALRDTMENVVPLQTSEFLTLKVQRNRLEMSLTSVLGGSCCPWCFPGYDAI